MTEVLFDVVDNENAWRRTAEVLLGVPRLAVDIEANSLYAYREQICLIQVSTDRHNFIIDPLSGISLKALKQAFENPAVEKIFHAAEYDLALIGSLYGWRVTNLFDTMWAGRILGFPKMGLASFLENLYGIQLDKKHQKANWAERPLSHDKLVYACNDTCHLLRMRDDLGRQLAEKDLEEECAEVFHALCRPSKPHRAFDPNGFWKLPGARTLPPRAQSVLKALFIFREDLARQRDVPPFKVLDNNMMLQLAKVSAGWNGHPPGRLPKIPGVPAKVVDRLSPHILEVIFKALGAPPPVYPARTREHSPGYWQRHELLMQWRKEAAVKRGVESDVVLSRETLEELAEKCPRGEADLESIVTLGPRKRNLYGKSILTILNQ